MGSFKTNPWSLEDLLKDSERGVMKLPDFQRGWVWDEDRIKSLIASVSMAFPIGALMRLETGGEVQFKERLVEGAPKTPRTRKLNTCCWTASSESPPSTSLVCVRMSSIQY